MMSISKENVEEIEGSQVFLSQVENFCEDNLHKNYFEVSAAKDGCS